jgi:hypothetical protein
MMAADLKWRQLEFAVFWIRKFLLEIFRDLKARLEYTCFYPSQMRRSKISLLILEFSCVLIFEVNFGISFLDCFWINLFLGISASVELISMGICSPGLSKEYFGYLGFGVFHVSLREYV